MMDNVFRGSYVGVGSGMLELLFDNSHAFFRSKNIHVRLGVADEQTYYCFFIHPPLLEIPLNETTLQLLGKRLK